jgi:polyisoprenoid-binding protein YceI
VKKRTRRNLVVSAGIVIVLGAAAVIIGPRIYVAYASGSAQAPPALTAPPAAGASGERVGDLSGNWVVGPHSYAGYRVSEVLEGQRLEVTGRTSKVSGELDASGLTLDSATVTVQVGSIATTEPARDAYFRDVALNTAKYPTATFTLAHPIKANPAVTGKPQTFTADGQLAMHGVTRNVSFQLQAELTAGGGQVVGQIPITFADYGVAAPSLGFVTVQKSGDVEFLLNLVKQ